MEQRIEILKMIFTQSSEYTREQAKKRDNFISIYFVLFVAYLGFLSSNVLQDKTMFIITGVMMVMIGAFFSLIIINLRCWILQYASCARVISAQLLEDSIPDSPEAIKQALWEKVKSRSGNNKKIFRSVGNVISAAFIFISSTPIFITAFRIQGLSMLMKIIISTSGFLVYTVILMFSLVRRMKEVDSGEYTDRNGEKHPTWIIDFDS